MVKMLKPRLGVADDPTTLQPSLQDCLGAVLQQAEPMMAQVLKSLVRGMAPAGPHSIPALQSARTRAAVAALDTASAQVQASYVAELSHLVYEGGGKDQVATEVLRYEDLQLFGDDELDQSIEVARALQEVSIAVDDVLPGLDALVSTLLGWRTVQPGLNPLRPDVFVRALQSTLARHVPDAPLREVLIAPTAGLLGVQLHTLYRELAGWLQSGGVEPALPVGGLGAIGAKAPMAGTMAKTLLNLDRLRKLLAGDFDRTSGKPEFLSTVPASLSMLQEFKQVDVLVKRLEQRPRAAPAAQGPVAAHEPAPVPRLGRRLGDEVLRLMFDTLSQDQRLLPGYREQLASFEPAVRRLAAEDSRFFSDRTHPARQFLDRVTQRSLAFKAESDEGWRRFLDTVRYASNWLGESRAVDAETFGELLDHLQSVWAEHDQVVRQRREDGARALLHAEQRNLLAQKLAESFEQAAHGLDVPAFVLDFLRGTWPQVVAEAQLSCTDGSDDPFGYRAMVDDLIWSVQKSTAQRSRARRLTQLVPGLLDKLRQGLDGMQYPPELSRRFFDSLMALHEAVLRGAQDEAAQEAVQAAQDEVAAAQAARADPYLAGSEAADSGWIDVDSLPPAQEEPLAGSAEPAAAPAAAPVAAPAELRTGTWAELVIQGEWTRVQLTWASPHGTLFMFTSLTGTAHSMSRRTRDRLRAQGLLRVVAERGVVDDAFDQVAKAALRNSLDGKS